MIILSQKNDLVQRRSDKGVMLKNNVTGELYSSPVDLSNDKRKELGLVPLEYTETNITISEVED